jgi:hypothetical protein
VAVKEVKVHRGNRRETKQSIRPLTLTIAISIVDSSLRTILTSSLGRGGILLHNSLTTNELQFSLKTDSHLALLVPQLLHLFELGLQVTHGLIHEELLQRPLLDISSLILLEVVDVLDGAGEDGTLGLFASSVWYDSTKLIDTLVDVPSSATLDFFLKGSEQKAQRRMIGETHVVILPLPLPFFRANGRVAPSAGSSGRGTPAGGPIS